MAASPTSTVVATDAETLAVAPAPPVEAARSRRNRWTAATVAAVLLLLGAVYLVDWLLTKDELERGTTIAGVDVGGLTAEQANARLDGELGGFRAPVVLRSHGQDVSIDPATSGLAVDVSTSVAAAGTRSANPFTRIGALLGRTTDAPLIATADETALTAAVQSIAAASDVVPVEGALSVDGGTVAVVEPVAGEQLDVPAAVAVISSTWTGGHPEAVRGLTLPVDEKPVRVSATGLSAAADEARAILSGPLTVVVEGTSSAVPVQTIAAALSIAPDDADGFTVSVDRDPIKAAFRDAAEAAQVQPVNASVSIVDNAPVITPASDGRMIDVAATDAALDAALRAPDRTLTVVYAAASPEVSTEAVQALGIKEVVSEFTTGGFAADSGQNVKRVAEQVQGAIIKPGETFSLNGYTGQRAAPQGYVEANIIQDGVIARAVGGGISQFATTLYNASYFAGFTDIEHKAHSFYISRYPAGREATVFEADDGTSIIDVKFSNPTSTAVLVQTVWTPDDITVRFWGTKSVEVESITGDKYKFTDAPRKTIPYGEPCKATPGTQGFSIDNTRVVRDLAGAEVSRKTTTTVYNGQVKITCTPPPPVVVAPPAPDPAAPAAVPDPAAPAAVPDPAAPPAGG